MPDTPGTRSPRKRSDPSAHDGRVCAAAELGSCTRRERTTLLVRIMAAGPRLPEAIADLAALPADAHERAVAEQILVHLQHVIGKKPGRTPEEEEFIMSMHGTWKEAQELGRAEGEARALLTVLRGRGIAVPDIARERILAEKDQARLERWIETASVAASLAEVLDDPS